MKKDTTEFMKLPINDPLQKDLDKLAKKHKIAKFVFVTDSLSKPDKRMMYVISEDTDPVECKKLGQEVATLFKNVGLSSSKIKKFNDFISEVDRQYKENKLHSIMDSIKNKIIDTETQLKNSIKEQILNAERLLSDTDWKTLKDIRQEKHDFVVKQNYEKASECRDRELKFLKIR